MWPIRAEDGSIIAFMFQVLETKHFHQQVTAMNEALMVASVRQHELAE
jgi:two-component system NtrC family sensor kinase